MQLCSASWRKYIYSSPVVLQSLTVHYKQQFRPSSSPSRLLFHPLRFSSLLVNVSTMAQVWGIPGVSVCPLAIDDQGNFTPFPMVDGDKSQYFARKYVTITTGAKFAIEVRLHSYSSDANQEHLVDKMRVVCLLDGAEGINCTLESSDFISKAGENVLTKKFLSVQGQGCFLLVFKEINIGKFVQPL